MIHDLIRICAVRDLVPTDTTPHTLHHTFATRYLAAIIPTVKDASQSRSVGRKGEGAIFWGIG
jgi:integrase